MINQLWDLRYNECREHFEFASNLGRSSAMVVTSNRTIGYVVTTSDWYNVLLLQ